MNEYQITFIINDTKTSIQMAFRLNQLMKKFKSIFYILNITQNRCVEFKKSISILQAGLLEGDLCQLTALGIDAELACFILKDILTEYVTVIGSQINHNFSNQLAKHFPQICPPCEVNWSYAKAQTVLTKFECLTALAQLIHPSQPDELILAFIKREECSSTCITPGIALPHTMFAGVKDVSLAVIVNEQAIDWESKIGKIHLAIALVIPLQCTKEHLIAVTNLSRNLLNPKIAERLLLTKTSIDLQTLLMYIMLKLLP